MQHDAKEKVPRSTVHEYWVDLRPQLLQADMPIGMIAPTLREAYRVDDPGS